MSALAGPLTIAALLIVGAGAAKARTPADTARALHAVGVGVSPRIVRIGAVAEIGIGVGALFVPSPAFVALVAASYAVFAVFVLTALRAGTAISSCGCFGKIDTPPSRVHIVVDGAFACAALAVAVSGVDVTLPTVIADQPMLGIPFLLLVAVGTGLAFLAFTSLPRTFALVRARS